MEMEKSSAELTIRTTSFNSSMTTFLSSGDNSIKISTSRAFNDDGWFMSYGDLNIRRQFQTNRFFTELAPHCQKRGFLLLIRSDRQNLSKKINFAG
jgi:hypothetical protein